VNVVEDIKTILADTLSLGSRKATLTEATSLLGSIPQLDSMAVVAVITAMEDHFGISVADDEISADTFATLGSLVTFVQGKLSGS
jgi:acyl carrier protein